MVDNTIALQVKTPDSMTSMSNMLGVANGMQQLQSNNITLTERKNLQQVLSNPDKYNDASGNPDYSRMIPDIMKAAPTTGADYVTKIVQGHQAATNAKDAVLGLEANKRKYVGQYLMGLANDRPDIAKAKLDAFKNANPDLAPVADFGWNYHLAPATQSPETFKAAALKFAQGTMDVGNQNVATTPSYTDTGGTLDQNNPMAGAAGAKPQIEKTLPPTTQEIDQSSGARKAVGKTAGGRSIQTELSPTEIGTAETVNKDYAQRVADAKNAERNVGVLQNIQKYAEGAITGIGSDRRSWVAGLAGLLGMSEEQLAKTDTDLLKKNEKMLALAGGDTNLAKSLAESANPNTKMTKEAIKDAARQVIAQNQIHTAGAHYLGQFLGDYKSYNKELNEWNKHADPRILELPFMSPEERKKMAESMGPEKSKKFAESVRYMQERGILK